MTPTRTPAPPLDPLEAELEALMQIELTEGLEGPMDHDLDSIRRSHLSVAEVAALKTALRNLCLAVEDWLEEDDSSDLFDHYMAARAALGESIEILPGGPEGEHFHLLDFEPEEGCQDCDDHGRALEVTP